MFSYILVGDTSASVYVRSVWWVSKVTDDQRFIRSEVLVQCLKDPTGRSVSPGGSPNPGSLGGWSFSYVNRSAPIAFPSGVVCVCLRSSPTLVGI